MSYHDKNMKTGKDFKDPRAVRAMSRWDQLKVDRLPDEDDWASIDTLVRGAGYGGFTGDQQRHKREKALSSSPIMAMNNFASELHGTLINPANKWMELKSPNPDLARFKPMAEWSDMVTDMVLASFRPAVSNFYSSAIQMLQDVSAFAQGAQYDEMLKSEGKILDVTLHLGEIVVAIDAWGRVSEYVRKYELTAEQAARKFGVDKLPEKITKALDSGSVDRFCFFQHVYINEEWQKGKLGWLGKRVSSVHACEEGHAVVRHSGFHEMPMHFPRWEVTSGRTYAIGPGHHALPASRVLQQMQAANLRAGQNAADPTLLAPDESVWPLNGQIRPGSVMYNGLNARGERMVQALDNYSGTGLTLEMQQEKVQEIQNAFNWSLLNLSNRTGLTPVEAMERQQEKYRMMAPNLGRIQDEYLAPKIRRRLRMLIEAKQLPPLPPEVPPNASLDVFYTSAAAQAQQASEGAATSRAINELGPLIQMGKTRILDRMAEDDIIEVVFEAFGVPSRALKSREDANAEAEARAKQEQAAAAMQAGQAGASMAKDMAQAEAAMAQGGGQ